MKSKNIFTTLAVMIALLASACGGTSSSDNDSDGPLELRVVQSSKSVAYFPLFVAAEEGFFADEGLDVGEPTVLGGDSKVAAALAGGSADIGGGVATTSFLLADGNRDPRVVANLLNAYYVDVIVGDQFDQPDEDASLEEKVRSLKGARVGVPAPSGGGAALLQALFEPYGMDIKKDIKMVNLGGETSAALGALKTDRVNALAWFQPVSQQVETDGIGSIFISPSRGDVPAMADQPHGFAITTAAILEEKPEAIGAFIRAVARAQELIHEDEAKTRELFKKYQPALPAETLDALMPVLLSEIPTSPVLDEAGYDKTLKFHQDAGLAENAPTWAEMTGDQFAEQALESK